MDNVKYGEVFNEIFDYYLKKEKEKNKVKDPDKPYSDKDMCIKCTQQSKCETCYIGGTV